jgi:hypothetical protein
MSDVVVYKNRTNVLRVNLGIDVSLDTITSEIREKALLSSPLIATWVVSFVTNGTDGQLLLTLDNAFTGSILVKSGYMDLKRVTGAEPIAVFSKPIKVVFQDTVTQ